MSSAQFFGALAAVLVAMLGNTLVIAAWLGGRLDRVVNEMHQLHQDMMLR